MLTFRRFILICTSLLTIGSAANSFQSSNAVGLRVLAVFSYLPGLWSSQAEKGIRTAFKERSMSLKLETYVYDYLRKRTERKSELQKVKHLINKLQPDFILIFDDEATEDLLPELNKLGVPIVVTGINKELAATKWWMKDFDKNRNFTGVLERYPFNQSLDILRKINGKIKKISILTSENDSSKIIVNQLIKTFSAANNTIKGVELKDVLISKSWSQWQAFILSHKRLDEAFWILVPWDVLDESGKEVNLKTMGDFYRKNSVIPELGIVSANNMFGFLACFSVNSEDLAYQGASIGIHVVRDRIFPNSIPFENVKSVRFTLNKKRAESLGYQMPLDLLEFAHIETKIPLEQQR